MKFLVALVAVAALAAAPLSGCGADDPGPASAPADRASTSATSEAPAGSELEGVWHTAPLSLEDTEATIRRHGLGRWVDDYRAHAPFSDDTVLILTIENGTWDLYGASGSGEPLPIDYDAEYVIDGNLVVFEHSDGNTTHRWSVDGGTLTFAFVETTLGGYEGIPDEVFQRALYMSAPFTRQG